MVHPKAKLCCPLHPKHRNSVKNLSTKSGFVKKKKKKSCSKVFLEAQIVVEPRLKIFRV